MSGVTVELKKELPGFALNVSWEVEGGFSVLFGYSGAGKSLTLSMIAGTMRPDSGRVMVGDQVLVDTSSGVFVPPQRRRIGYLSQHGDLFPHMTVRGNIEYALKGVPRAERAERVTELLETLHISELAEKRPNQISGGQKQRAALARALAPRPRALLFDEPLSALDLPIRIEIRKLLRAVQRDLKVPVIMVTHDLYEACTLAHTLVVYSGAGHVQVGRPWDVINDPCCPEISRLLHAMELPSDIFRSAESAVECGCTHVWDPYTPAKSRCGAPEGARETAVAGTD